MRSVCEQIVLADYRAQTEGATAKIYEAQLSQNTVMLWLVVALTAAGVILAGIQLWASYRLAKAGQGMLASGGEATIEQGKLVVRSSVVGIIILTLSFAFFLVYVLYVYQITEVGGSFPVQPREVPAGAQEIPR
jgi:sterol desaturase/sphingolipid hydroxylase (fatty acid hydroxylase superfamily)